MNKCLLKMSGMPVRSIKRGRERIISLRLDRSLKGLWNLSVKNVWITIFWRPHHFSTFPSRPSFCFGFSQSCSFPSFSTSTPSTGPLNFSRASLRLPILPSDKFSRACFRFVRISIGFYGILGELERWIQRETTACKLVSFSFGVFHTRGSWGS